MCSNNLEGICTKKLEVENIPHEDIFNEHIILSEQQEICKFQCNGYDKSCRFYKPVTLENFRNLINLTFSY